VQEARITSSTARRRAASADAVGLLSGLTARDLYLIDVLDKHRVLTASQVTELLFPSLDRAQRRLLALTQRGVLARFRGYTHVGSLPWRYTLGYPAVQLLAAGHAQQPTSRAAHDRSVAQLARSRQLEHRLGANGFFTALAAHAATDPAAKLLSWYSESTTWALIPGQDRFLRSSARPDGYGRWADATGDVGFVLEYDTGSEPVGRLVDKLAAYRENPNHLLPVLLHLPSSQRETHLHRAAGIAHPYPVATTAVDRLAATGHSLAGPVWLPIGAATQGRRRLSELKPPKAARILWAEDRHGTATPPAPHLPLVA
jgi:hypothetical protein